MDIIEINNQVIEGSAGRPILFDIYFIHDKRPKPAIIFSHGFKGYKDWGAFHLMAEYFASKGFIFFKFNFSFNGGTVDDPIDFPDLEAFGKNNYSIELNDLGLMIDHVNNKRIQNDHDIDITDVYLLGHSRGGGISILKAGEDERVAKLAVLAAVGDFEKRFPTGDALATWADDGVYFIQNSRTKQSMPLYYQFYQNFMANRVRLDIPAAASRIQKPMLIVHGSADETVAVSEAHALQACQPAAQLNTIEGANHTFGMQQPWHDANLPIHFELVLDAVSNFFKPV